MLKKDVRSHYKELRKNLSEDALLNASLSIANRALHLPGFIWNLNYFHLFLPITEQREIDTSFILSILQGKDKTVVIPKVISATEMTHYLLLDNTRLIKNKWNIPEPVDGIEIKAEKLDVVFIPLLSFDKKGNRVGYGKGFYDRFLDLCKPDVVKIGLSLFDAEEVIEDVGPHDKKMDYCITPEKLYSFSED